jgi:hypothetical protein
MALIGNFLSEGTLTTAQEESVWRDTVPDTNYWMGSGRIYMESLSMDNIIFILERVPLARNDYLDAVNPKRPDYVALINTPMTQAFPETDFASKLNNQSGSVQFFHGVCKGIVPWNQ